MNHDELHELYNSWMETYCIPNFFGQDVCSLEYEYSNVEYEYLDEETIILCHARVLVWRLIRDTYVSTLCNLQVNTNAQ